MKENLNNIRLSAHLTSSSKATLSHSNELDDIRLSAHFKLIEFLNLQKYADNIPTMQAVVNLTYGCHMLLVSARKVVGPIIINSGFRCSRVNAFLWAQKY